MTSTTSNSIDEIIRSRRATRAFLPTPVPLETIRAILDTARHAPSGTNTQPWKVHVVIGAPLETLRNALTNVDNDPLAASEHMPEFQYYPEAWRSPYIDRRRKCGVGMYQVLGIEKGDTKGMHRQHNRNYMFFDAPVLLIFTIDRSLALGSWLDYGFFLQNVMLAATARGIDSCPQVSLAKYYRIIAEILKLSNDEMMVCGIALGHRDPDAAINSFRPEREPVEAFTTIHDT